jgi:uncharacterized membrane protein
VPFLLEDRPKERGGSYSKAANWVPHVQMDAGDRPQARIVNSRLGSLAQDAPLIVFEPSQVLNRRPSVLALTYGRRKRLDLSIMMHFREIVEIIGTVVETAGVAIMVIGATIATVRFLFRRHGNTVNAYRLCRQDMGRAILLGLEFLVAGDIIDTVVVDPTLDNVMVLGMIIVIRTFLSIFLHLEVEHRWPWQHEVTHHDSHPTAQT